MPNTAPPAPTQSPRELRRPLSDARLAAVVQAAYILSEANR